MLPFIRGANIYERELWWHFSGDVFSPLLENDESALNYELMSDAKQLWCEKKLRKRISHIKQSASASSRQLIEFQLSRFVSQAICPAQNIKPGVEFRIFRKVKQIYFARIWHYRNSMSIQNAGLELDIVHSKLYFSSEARSFIQMLL